MNEYLTIEALGVLAAQVAAFGALLLWVSAGHKIVKWTHSRQVVLEFVGLPSSLAAPALAGVIGTEVGAGLLLLCTSASFRLPGAVLAASVWGMYLGLIARAVVRGRRDLDCGCSFGANHRPLGVFQMARNLVLIALAVAVAVVSAAEASVAIQFSQLLAACALLALYGALDQVMALQPMRQGQIL